MGALFRMAHSPPVTSLSPHFYGLLVVRYSLRFPLRTFRARLTSKAISWLSFTSILLSSHFRFTDNGLNVVVKPISCLAIRADILDELLGVGSAEPDALCVQKCPSADGAQSCQGGFIHLFCGLAVHLRTPFR